jgi:N-acyl-L-homoserine lactone synthetase
VNPGTSSRENGAAERSNGKRESRKSVESSDRDIGMRRLDDVSWRILAQSGPIDLRFAASEAERDAVYRLRKRVVVERGWGASEQLPDGRERDRFDDEAIHALGSMDGVPVATSRLVFPHPERRLPTEETFGVVVRPPGGVVDVGRISVSRDVDPPHRAVFWQLLALIWLEIRRRGFSRVCGANTTSMNRLYESMGFRVTPIGPARDHWGARRIPILMDVGETAGTIADRAAAYMGLAESLPGGSHR